LHAAGSGSAFFMQIRIQEENVLPIRIRKSVSNYSFYKDISKDFYQLVLKIRGLRMQKANKGSTEMKTPLIFVSPNIID
jgi:hypothetical protein